MGKGKDSFYAKYIKRILDFVLALMGLIVLDLMKVIPTMPVYDGNEEWIRNQLGGDVGKAFDC